MPTYDYECRSCGVVTEVIHSMLEEGPSSCDHCGGDLRRVLFPAGIIFKGPGFYRNDSRATSSSSSSTAPSGAGTDGGGSSGGGSSEGGGSSKTDAGTKPASTSTDAGATKKSESAGS